mmetsp:Transcript_2646/g.5510  ORF Transcript_2646/g.5510 Transcript_2646/m.5510 type:complete len:167 (+) Transcript_2646:301-801(+)
MVRTLSRSVRIRSRIRAHATEIFWANSLVRMGDIVVAAEGDAKGSFSTIPDGVAEAERSSAAYWERSRLQEWSSSERKGGGGCGSGCGGRSFFDVRCGVGVCGGHNAAGGASDAGSYFGEFPIFRIWIVGYSILCFSCDQSVHCDAGGSRLACSLFTPPPLSFSRN